MESDNLDLEILELKKIIDKLNTMKEKKVDYTISIQSNTN